MNQAKPHVVDVNEANFAADVDLVRHPFGFRARDELYAGTKVANTDSA